MEGCYCCLEMDLQGERQGPGCELGGDESNASEMMTGQSRELDELDRC